uniref:Uncharacterized protein n=1 Tax=Anguilla anguilla TaxID=7936 RepID=A0A0E9S448_ANGAN
MQRKEHSALKMNGIFFHLCSLCFRLHESYFRNKCVWYHK